MIVQYPRYQLARGPLGVCARTPGVEGSTRDRWLAGTNTHPIPMPRFLHTIQCPPRRGTAFYGLFRNLHLRPTDHVEFYLMPSQPLSSEIKSVPPYPWGGILASSPAITPQLHLPSQRFRRGYVGAQAVSFPASRTDTPGWGTHFCDELGQRNASVETGPRLDHEAGDRGSSRSIYAGDGAGAGVVSAAGAVRSGRARREETIVADAEPFMLSEEEAGRLAVSPDGSDDDSIATAQMPGCSVSWCHLALE